MTGELGATWVALHDGRISPEQAQVIASAIEKLPSDTGVRGRVEQALLKEAPHLDATDLATVVDRALDLVDPDGVAAREEASLEVWERAAYRSRELTLRRTRDGRVVVSGHGPVEDFAPIWTVLSAMNAPDPVSTPGNPAGPDTGEPDCDTSGRDVREYGARCWDALVEVCRHALATQTLPESHGQRPRVVVTLDYDTLASGVGAGTLESGDRLSAAAVRKLACDADVIPAVLGSKSELMDVGRAHRLVTATLFVALVIRDRHCAFPGCRRPQVACDAHHIVHWLDHGPTCLDNLVLLCRAHHTLIHATGWEVRLNPGDRRPEFRPPPGRLRQHAGADWIREPTSRR